MNISPLDQGIVVAYLVATLLMGLYVSRRATQSFEDYFVGGRSLSWWLAGFSMIASAFAIDTPLGIAGFVGKHGIQGVWFAWTYIIGGPGTFGAFIFAALLRRSNVLTVAELVELRYSGKGAVTLRAFKALYFGVMMLCIQMGWVIHSVQVLAQEAFGWDARPTLAIILTITIAYTMMSGLWGVAVTDFVQFFVGSIGSLLLAFFAVRSVGGLRAIPDGLARRYGSEQAAERLHFIPRPGPRADGNPSFFPTFMLFITLKWWNNPAPTMTQRLLATKDERHATWGQMLFCVTHFALNYWPMILVSLVGLISYPQIAVEKTEQSYAKVLINVLPPGALGVMLASMTAALMSTIDTQANTGASFMLNDVYKRFIRRHATTKHYVRASQVCTLLMLGLALIIAYFMSSVRAAWEYFATLLAGYGFVSVARWFWWRINAWSELAALAGSGVGGVVANQLLRPWLPTFGARFGVAAAISSASWITTAWVTPPTEMHQLAAFCRQVKPFRLGWGPVRRAYPDIEFSPDLRIKVGMWGVGLVMVFSLCFGVGHVVLGSTIGGLGLIGVAMLAAGLLLRMRSTTALADA